MSEHDENDGDLTTPHKTQDDANECRIPSSPGRINMDTLSNSLIAPSSPLSDASHMSRIAQV